MTRTLLRRIFDKLQQKFIKKKVLFVGVDEYNKQDVINLQEKNLEVWTIDIDPNKKQFGAKSHIIDSIENIDAHFKKPYFDIVLMLGVVGYGLKDPQKIMDVFKKIDAVLKPFGHAIFSMTTKRLDWGVTDDR